MVSITSNFGFKGKVRVLNELLNTHCTLIGNEMGKLKALLMTYMENGENLSAKDGVENRKHLNIDGDDYLLACYSE